MAATYLQLSNWLDTSADLDAPANWSLAAAPTTADDLRFTRGSQTIITDLDTDADDVDYDSIHVGRNFEGAIGDASHIWCLGSLEEIIFEGSRCKECWWTVGSGKAVVLLRVLDSGPGSNALVLYGGTWTDVQVQKCGHMRIGAAATLTSLKILGGVATISRLTVETGATLTAVIQHAGVVNSSAAAVTLNIHGGTWNHIGGTTFNITTLNIYGGQFNFHTTAGSGAPTITTCNLYGGILDANGGDGNQRIITTLNRYGGTIDRRDAGASLAIDTHNIYGGSELMVRSAPVSA